MGLEPSARDEKAILTPSRFEVTEEMLESVRVIAVSGELDLNTAPELEQRLDAALAAEDGCGVLLDLSDCGFIDSTGIGLIVSAWRGLDGDADSDGGERFAVCGTGAQVRRLFEITGLESSIRTFGGREEALAKLRGD